MATTNTFTKDPDAVLDYQLDLSLWLATGDEIDSVVWTPAGDLVVDSQSETATAATVWLSGGTVGEEEITAHVVTTAGRENDWTLVFTIAEN